MYVFSIIFNFFFVSIIYIYCFAALYVLWLLLIFNQFFSPCVNFVLCIVEEEHVPSTYFIICVTIHIILILVLIFVFGFSVDGDNNLVSNLASAGDNYFDIIGLLFSGDFCGFGFILILISFIFWFLYFVYDVMHVDLILCYIFLECSLLLIVLLYCVMSFVFLDIRFLVFSIFLIAIAACEIAIGLCLLVRFK